MNQSTKTKTLQLKADIGDVVRIASLECRSVIIGLYLSRHCLTYEVAYFHNGDRKTAYLYDHEIELVPA